MPSNWEIWVSSDRRSWRLLQKMTDGTPWQEGEERHFDVDAPIDIMGVKLVITTTRAKSCMRLYEFRPLFAPAAAG